MHGLSCSLPIYVQNSPNYFLAPKNSYDFHSPSTSPDIPTVFIGNAYDLIWPLPHTLQSHPLLLQVQVEARLYMASKGLHGK